MNTLQEIITPPPPLNLWLWLRRHFAAFVIFFAALVTIADGSLPRTETHRIEEPCGITLIGACLPRKVVVWERTQGAAVETTQGFTLVEIAIVLTVIGLIVGGVLVGQTVIAQAGMRGTISEFEQFNTAANEFRTKYNCIPGDCANATDFFSSSAINVPGMGANGNGDGMLLDWYGSTFPLLIDMEPQLFWSHLFAAGFTKCCNGALYSQNNSYVTIGITVPQDKVNGFGIATGYMNGRNGYFWGITQNTGGTGWSDICGGIAASFCNLSPQRTGVISPAQAQAIDTKIDDGMPTTGNVYVAWLYGGDNRLHPAYYYPGLYCLNNTTPATYNTTYVGAPVCSLWINMQGM